jgi:inner membrane protein
LPTVIGHSIVGIAAGSYFRSKPYAAGVFLLCVLCSVAPDIDSLGFRLGIPYGHWLGHRGFCHGVFFAAMAAFAAALCMLRYDLSRNERLRLFSVFFLCGILHDILDAMTNGGLGVAFFSPFSDERFFLPFRPIEVSPLSARRLFSARGLAVMASEFVWVVVPSLCFAVWAARRSKRKSRSA